MRRWVFLWYRLMMEDSAEKLQNIKDGLQTDILIMDFSKAFDKVSHKHLMEKLKFYGIRGKLNTRISDLLTYRTQAVVMDGERFYEAHVRRVSPRPQPLLVLHKRHRWKTGFNSETLRWRHLVYLAVRNSDDADSLQNDLHKLGRWEKMANGIPPGQMSSSHRYQEAATRDLQLHPQWAPAGICQWCQISGHHLHERHEMEPAHW